MTSPLTYPLNPTFIESARPAITNALVPHNIPADVTHLIADYAIQGKAFMAQDWKKFYGVEVEDLKIGSEFYDWWVQPDALDRSKLNCYTHFPPILCPQTVLLEPKKAPPPALRHRFEPCVDRAPYNLETLGHLVQNPKEGFPSQIRAPSFLYSQLKEKTKDHLACYIVVRKKELDRYYSGGREEKKEFMRKINEETHAGYEVMPQILHLATAALVHHTVTGERYLSDGTGMEKCRTYGVCREVVRQKLSNNREVPCFVVLGGHQLFISNDMDNDSESSGGLTVSTASKEDIASDFCVVGLRKFPAIRN